MIRNFFKTLAPVSWLVLLAYFADKLMGEREIARMLIAVAMGIVIFYLFVAVCADFKEQKEEEKLDKENAEKQQKEKENKIWRKCGLVSEGEYPTLLRIEGVGKEKKLIYKIPDGVCIQDFEKAKDRLEQHYKNKVEVTLNSRYELVISFVNK